MACNARRHIIAYFMQRIAINDVKIMTVASAGLFKCRNSRIDVGCRVAA